MIRVLLTYHLQNLARSGREVQVLIEGPTTLGKVLDALEDRYPVLRGTIRDHVTQHRRPYIWFFAAGEDISLVPLDHPLPQSVSAGSEPLLIVGAMAGG